jgi:hypothetical protein
MATNAEHPTHTGAEASIFDKLAEQTGDMLSFVLLAIGAGLTLTIAVLAYMHGMGDLVVDLWLGALAVIFFGVGLYSRFATYQSREITRGDQLRLLTLALAGLAGFFTALLGPFLAIWKYSDIFSGGVETWRHNPGTIVLCALPLFGGLVLMFVGLMLGRAFERTQPELRRLLYGYNSVLGALLLFAVLGLLNLISYTHVKPFSGLGATLDWTTGGIYTLQEGSQSVLDNLKEPTEVFVILQRGDPVTGDVELLLENCRAINQNIRYQVLSPSTDRAAIEEKSKNFNIPGLGVLILYGPAGSEKNEFIPRDELVTSSFDPKGGEQEIFQGEFALMKAFSYLEAGKTKTKIYFTQGNGELDFNDSSTRQPDKGLGQLVSLLGKGNFDLAPLPLDKKSALNDKGQPIDLPADADLVVIAGPRRPFAPEAVAALRNYLKPSAGRKPGKLLVLLDVIVVDGKMEKTGLEELVGGYGVTAGDSRILNMSLDNPLEVYVFPNTDSENPIAKTFYSGSKITTFSFSDVRTVQPAPPSPARNYATDIILEASPQLGIWAEDNLGADPQELRAAIGRNREKLVQKLSRGPLPVAVAISESSLPPGHPGIGGGTQKPVMVVFGDATWVSNAYANRRSNFNLFTSCVSWLRERPEIGVMPNPPKKPTYEFTAPEDAAYRMLWMPGVLMLVAVIGLSMGVWLVRRR